MYLFTQTAYALLTLTALTLATPAPKVDSNTETQLDTPTAVRILDTHCVTYWQGKIGSVCGGQVKEGQNGCSLDDTWIVTCTDGKVVGVSACGAGNQCDYGMWKGHPVCLPSSS